MPSTTIVPDDILSSLILAGPADYTDAETRDDV
jgi:hypothetical protein